MHVMARTGRPADRRLVRPRQSNTTNRPTTSALLVAGALLRVYRVTRQIMLLPDRFCREAARQMTSYKYAEATHGEADETTGCLTWLQPKSIHLLQDNEAAHGYRCKERRVLSETLTLGLRNSCQPNVYRPIRGTG